MPANVLYKSVAKYADICSYLQNKYAHILKICAYMRLCVILAIKNNYISYLNILLT